MKLQKNGYAIVKVTGKPVRLLSHDVGYWQTDIGEYRGRELQAIAEETYYQIDDEKFFDEVNQWDYNPQPYTGR